MSLAELASLRLEWKMILRRSEKQLTRFVVIAVTALLIALVVAAILLTVLILY